MRVFLQAIGRHRFSLLSLPGVVSIGVGIKTTRGINTGVPSLVVGVEKKLPLRDLSKDQIIPRHIDRLPTDVVQVGRVKMLGYALPNPQEPPWEKAEPRKKRVRPAQPGVSIGHYKVSAGTFGAVVRGDFPGGIAILSNNHILANSTDGHDDRARIGDPILQPGPYDNGSAGDVIARLHSFSPIIPEGKSGQKHLNSIDAAIAVPVEKDVINSEILGLGSVKGTAPAFPGMPVMKSGRSSGVTRGVVTTVGTTLRVENNDQMYVFSDQIGTTAQSQPGDSGSLFLNQSGRAVGLLFAGSEEQSFANPINPVLKYFGVSL
ncbi:MAG: S1 family peptidase [Peptococcaceae bacterium]|nr:S1 family peptidase [Peptococcaceae bacterium]